MFLSDVKTLPSFSMGDITYRFELEEPSDDNEVIKTARRRIGETPGVMKKAKRELVNLLKSNMKYIFRIRTLRLPKPVISFCVA